MNQSHLYLTLKAMDDAMKVEDLEMKEALLTPNASGFLPEILFKETKLKNRFIQANSTRYFLRITSNALPIQVKVYIYRCKISGNKPWIPEEGDLEKDNPQIISIENEQTTVPLKIFRNSF